MKCFRHRKKNHEDAFYASVEKKMALPFDYDRIRTGMGLHSRPASVPAPHPLPRQRRLFPTLTAVAATLSVLSLVALSGMWIADRLREPPPPIPPLSQGTEEVSAETPHETEREPSPSFPDRETETPDAPGTEPPTETDSVTDPLSETASTVLPPVELPTETDPSPGTETAPDTSADTGDETLPDIGWEAGISLPADCEINMHDCVIRSETSRFAMDGVVLDFCFDWNPAAPEAMRGWGNYAYLELCFSDDEGNRHVVKRIDESFFARKLRTSADNAAPATGHRFTESLQIPPELFTEPSGMVWFGIYGWNISLSEPELQWIASITIHYQITRDRVILSVQPDQTPQSVAGLPAGIEIIVMPHASPQYKGKES